MSPLNLFYSYSHLDSEYRSSLEKHLSMLVRNGVIKQWYDKHITAGSHLESKIIENLEAADIVVFLVTKNWLSSDACIEEWEKAKLYSSSQPNKRLIPIIATDCAWKDFDNMKTMLVLPSDGKPVAHWKPMDSAWSNVYDGIKDAAEEIKKNFKLRPEFEEELRNVEFCSAKTNDISLEDVFVFPNLTTYSDSKNGVELVIKDFDELKSESFQFIVGENQSGKTKICSWLYLELNRIKVPCMYVDLSQVGNSKDKNKILKDLFVKQQTGDFDLWLSLPHKYIIFDNLVKDSYAVEIIKYAEQFFSNIVICSSVDLYRSYYIDDERFIDYREVNIRPFCHGKQEQLIKNWLKVKSSGDDVDHSLIDSMEANINSIVNSTNNCNTRSWFVAIAL